MPIRVRNRSRLGMVLSRPETLHKRMEKLGHRDTAPRMVNSAASVCYEGASPWRVRRERERERERESSFVGAQASPVGLKTMPQGATPDLAARPEAAVTTALGRRSIVLVGMMGSGKSSIGRRVALRLGIPFVDADAEI